MTSAKRILEWTTPSGEEKTLLLIKDSSLEANDIDYKKFEIAKYNDDLKRWETEEEVDYVDSITHVGIPEGLAD